MGHRGCSSPRAEQLDRVRGPQRLDSHRLPFTETFARPWSRPSDGSHACSWRAGSGFLGDLGNVANTRVPWQPAGCSHVQLQPVQTTARAGPVSDVGELGCLAGGRPHGPGACEALRCCPSVPENEVVLGYFPGRPCWRAEKLAACLLAVKAAPWCSGGVPVSQGFLWARVTLQKGEMRPKTKLTGREGELRPIV